MKPVLGMVVAMTFEISYLLGRGSWRQIKKHSVLHNRLKDGTDLIIVHAGVGEENAVAAARWLLSEGVTALTSMGFAGGLHPGLRAGDLIIAESIFQIDGGKILGPWDADATSVTHSHSALTAKGISVHCGPLITTLKAVLTSDHKKYLLNQTRALAVDMESAFVAKAAQEKNIPFFIMRAICDSPNETVPRELYGCLNKNGNVCIPSVLLHLARRPYLVIDLGRMSRHFSAAGTALRRGWRVLLKSNLPRLLSS